MTTTCTNRKYQVPNIPSPANMTAITDVKTATTRTANCTVTTKILHSFTKINICDQARHMETRAIMGIDHSSMTTTRMINPHKMRMNPDITVGTSTIGISPITTTVPTFLQDSTALPWKTTPRKYSKIQFVSTNGCSMQAYRPLQSLANILHTQQTSIPML